MDGFSLKARAVTFAVVAGVVVFILALLASVPREVEVGSMCRALIAALVCGAMSWAWAEQALAGMAQAIDRATDRLAAATRGDLTSPVPGETAKCVPPLADAMERLFQQFGSNMDAVQRLALYDPVTALPNRTHFRQSCERLLADAPVEALGAMVFIDLDRFKQVNDTLGHAVGDQLLHKVAARLQATATSLAQRPGWGTPLPGRLAGDEFTLFFPLLPDEAHAHDVGVAILDVLNEPFVVEGHSLQVGASVGIALKPRHGLSLTDLMRCADVAMYRAKAGGRGRVELFSDELAAEQEARTQLEQDLRGAVARNEFALVFQPKVSARDGRIVGAEALLRWRHPAGERMPVDFLDRAEKTGLIVEMGEWVTQAVAETVARWANRGVEQRLAFNVSPRQLNHAAFFHQLREALAKAGAPAALLELELSETLVMHCSPDVLDAIAALRRDGASIAIDDFGTGYSNLPRLRRLPIDRVKLDRSLIEHVATNAEARTIAQAVIGLVHGIGCETVGEGIENAAQAEVLRIIGCDVLQGYAIAPPMPEDEFLSWLDDARQANARRMMSR